MFLNTSSCKLSIFSGSVNSFSSNVKSLTEVFIAFCSSESKKKKFVQFSPFWYQLRFYEILASSAVLFEYNFSFFLFF